MADCSDLSDAMTSDSYFDYTCNSCEDNGRNVEAIFYCKNCDKQYCCQCITFHNKILQEHELLGRQEVGQWGIVGHQQTGSGGIGTCTRHDGKVLEMYCRDHDRLCCSICITVDHRSCKVVQHLPEVASGIRNSSDFQAMLAQVNDIQTKLEDLQSTQTDTIKSLQDTCTDIRTCVTDARKRTEQTLADLEENTFKELEEINQKLAAKLAENINHSKALIDVLNPLQKVMEERTKTSDSLAYIGYKQCKEQLEDARDFIQQVSQQTFKITYCNYPQIAQCLSSMTALGKFKVTPNLDDKGHAIYMVESPQLHKVKVDDDINTIEIWGICSLPDGKLMIADSGNQCVKLLDKNYQVLARYSTLPLYPNDVCHIQGKAVAVSLGDRGSQHVVQYMLVNFNNQIMPGRRVPFDHVCGGIVFHKGTLYVSSNTALYAYNKDTTLNRKIYEDLSGKWTIHKFAISTDGRHIYMTNIDKNQLVTIDSKGNKLQTFSDPKLKWPTGVCVAEGGTVFVCGYESGTLIEVDRTGKERLATLAIHSDGIYAPYSLLCDSSSMKLIVGQVSENLLVFKMVKE